MLNHILKSPITDSIFRPGYSLEKLNWGRSTLVPLILVGRVISIRGNSDTVLFIILLRYPKEKLRFFFSERKVANTPNWNSGSFFGGLSLQKRYLILILTGLKRIFWYIATPLFFCERLKSIILNNTTLRGRRQKNIKKYL